MITEFKMDRRLVLWFRLLFAWIFLYAGGTQVFSGAFSVVAFLSHTKTFHDVYAPLTAPAIAPVMTFLVSYGHLLIGLSLLTGLLVRISGICGALLMLTYWTAHMDWPYIETHVNFVIDYHIVYASMLFWLAAVRAGQVWGLDSWVSTNFRGALPEWLVETPIG